MKTLPGLRVSIILTFCAFEAMVDGLSSLSLPGNISSTTILEEISTTHETEPAKADSAQPYVRARWSTHWSNASKAESATTADAFTWPSGSFSTTSIATLNSFNATLLASPASETFPGMENSPNTRSVDRLNTTRTIVIPPPNRTTTHGTNNSSQKEDTTPNGSSTSLLHVNITAVHASAISNNRTAGGEFPNSTISRYIDPFLSWSTCSSATYPTDYSVALRSLPLECDIGDSVRDLLADFWGNYDFVDRCFARYCKTSWISAVGAYTGTLTGLTTTSVTWMDLDIQPVYKTILTASDEDPVEYMSWIYGALHSTILTCAFPLLIESHYTNIADTKMADLIVKPERPCCGRCAIRVSHLHIYYWPGLTTNDTSNDADRDGRLTQHPSPTLSYVDANNFTLSVSGL
jgi:hypothetical protein